MAKMNKTEKNFFNRYLAAFAAAKQGQAVDSFDMEYTDRHITYLYVKCTAKCMQSMQDKNMLTVVYNNDKPYYAIEGFTIETMKPALDDFHLEITARAIEANGKGMRIGERRVVDFWNPEGGKSYVVLDKVYNDDKSAYRINASVC